MGSFIHTVRNQNKHVIHFLYDDYDINKLYIAFYSLSIIDIRFRMSYSARFYHKQRDISLRQLILIIDVISIYFYIIICIKTERNNFLDMS